MCIVKKKVCPLHCFLGVGTLYYHGNVYPKLVWLVLEHPFSTMILGNNVPVGEVSATSVSISYRIHKYRI